MQGADRGGMVITGFGCLRPFITFNYDSVEVCVLESADLWLSVVSTYIMVIQMWLLCSIHLHNGNTYVVNV